MRSLALTLTWTLPVTGRLLRTQVAPGGTTRSPSIVVFVKIVLQLVAACAAGADSPPSESATARNTANNARGMGISQVDDESAASVAQRRLSLEAGALTLLAAVRGVAA